MSSKAVCGNELDKAVVMYREAPTAINREALLKAQVDYVRAAQKAEIAELMADDPRPNHDWVSDDMDVGF